MTLLMHDAIYNRPFDDAEAAYLVAEALHPGGLPAGTYHFIVPDTWKNDAEVEGWAGIQFTTAQTVPVGGQIMLKWRGNVTVSNTKVSTYASPEDHTGIETNIVPTNGTGGTLLGTFKKHGEDCDNVINHYHRLRYGSNNWQESNIRQWLNSDAEAGAWWHPTHALDRLESAYVNLEGFLRGMDAGFAAVLGETDAITRRNTVYETDNVRGNLTYTTRDRIFLLSRDELGYGVEGIAQGQTLPYYEGAADADRIKYDYASKATARYWWLRSPLPGHAHYARGVSLSGAVSGYSAYYGNGAAPACVIY